MVRKTKAEADATRHEIVDAARAVFHERGVSRTSLEQVAEAAGCTRGAIYWHFKDKVDLFNAMMDRVTHPLEQVGSKSASMATLPPLERLRSMVDFVQRTIVQDERTRRVFEIALYRVEYVNDLAAVRDNHIEGCADFCALIEGELRSAAEDQNLQLPMEPHTAAMGVQALFDGLLQSWLLTHGRFDLVTVSRGVIDAYLRGLGFRL